MKNSIFDSQSKVDVYRFMGLRFIGPRFMGLWLLFSIIFFFIGEWIARTILPFLEVIFSGLELEFNSRLALIESDQGLLFKLESIAQQDIYRQEIPIAPKGSVFVAFTSLFHSIAPLSLIFASGLIFTTCAFYRPKFLSAFACVGFSLLFSLALLFLTTPFILLNNLESQFFFAAINFTHRDLPQPFVMHWVAFLELGGLWVIAIIFSIANLAISYKVNYLARKK